MKFILKKVYYCEFCKKHGLSAGSLRLHEKHCTGNRNRECRMCNRKIPPTKEYIKKANKLWRDFQTWRKLLEKKQKLNNGYKDSIGPFGEDVNRLNKDFQEQIVDELECPACTLAVIRQSKINEAGYIQWNYKETVADFWEEKNKEAKEESEREVVYGLQ